MFADHHVVVVCGVCRATVRRWQPGPVGGDDALLRMWAELHGVCAHEDDDVVTAAGGAPPAGAELSLPDLLGR